MEEKLGIRRKRGRRRVLAPLTEPDQIWTMDFTQDTFASGRRFGTLNLMDGCTRWAYENGENGVELHFITPGRPMENGYIESFNGKFRDECLNENWFLDLADARRKIGDWKWDYNHVRPHSALGYLTPMEFAKAWAVTGRGCVATTTMSENPNPEKVSLSWTKNGGQVSLHSASEYLTVRGPDQNLCHEYRL